MEKYCTRCGAKILDGDKACTNCGIMVDGSSNPSIKKNTTTKNGKTNGLALAGFIVSLVSTILCCGLFNIVSLVFSIIGLTKANEYNNGKGFSIAGIIISCIPIIFYILLSILISFYSYDVSLFPFVEI